MDPVIDFSKPKTTPEVTGESKKPKNGLTSYIKKIVILACVVLVFVYVYVSMYLPPSDFKKGTIIQIQNGDTVPDIVSSLYEHKVISSKILFGVMIRYYDIGRKLHPGDYLFDKEQNAYEVAMRLAKADYGVEEEKILVREGLSRSEMAEIFAKELPNFKTDDFMRLTMDDEGYLFPDTYSFFKSASTTDVINRMKNEFDEKTALYKNNALSQNKDWKDIIKIASLVELEGRTEDDRAMIADIIYRRLSSDMPLQLDAPFLYYMNKASLQLTQEDLFTVSPYNTYRNKGLPPTPICNPGLESIKAALYPKQNEYIYYLSDKNGKIHFATTFDEHKKNKKEYLNK